jgi:hypothetical protein
MQPSHHASGFMVWESSHFNFVDSKAPREPGMIYQNTDNLANSGQIGYVNAGVKTEDSISSSSRLFGRAILTDVQAQAIYRYKPEPFSKQENRAGALAKMFGVSVKTIRDIWVGRTWYRATYNLDSSKAPTIDRLLKKAGRPKGSKDSKPRVKKVSCPGSTSSEINALKQEDAVYRNDRKMYDGTCRTLLAVDSIPESDMSCCGRNTPCCACNLSSISPTSVEEDKPWHAGSDLFCETQLEALEDPFHDDWAFWPSDGAPEPPASAGAGTATLAFQVDQ